MKISNSVTYLNFRAKNYLKCNEFHEFFHDFNRLQKWDFLRDFHPLCFSFIYFSWEGADNDYEGILGYMEELFKEQDDQQHEIHVVHTCATDTENISRINANVQSIILKNILNQIGTS